MEYNLELNADDSLYTYLSSKNMTTNGIEYVFQFPYRFKVIVIKNDESLGHEHNLWEMKIYKKFYEYVCVDSIGNADDLKVNKKLHIIKFLDRDPHCH